MEGRDISVETVTQKGTQMEPGDQETITTGTITRITRTTRDRVIQGLVVSLNRDKSDRLKQKNSRRHQHHK